VPSKDPEAFAEKILTLIDDQELRKKMGEQGKKRILENFTMDKYIKGVEAVFEEVLEKKA
jgi:glycosyltransferase involved in cell wall biosynthesis